MQSFFAIHRLSAYIDGELPDHEAAEVERAIAADPQVRDEYERMLFTVDLLRTRGPVQAPPHLHAAILERVADEPDPVAGFWARLLAPFRAIPMEAVGLVFAVFAVVILINQDHSLEAPEPEAAVSEKLRKNLQDVPESVAVQPSGSKRSMEIGQSDQMAPPQPEAGLPPQTTRSTRGQGGKQAERSASPKGRDPQGKTSQKMAPPTPEKQRSQKEEKSSRKIVPPDQAYVAEWEQMDEGVGSTSQDALALYSPEPVFYRLDPKDEHGLLQLQKLVQGYGGSLKTLDGRAFTPRVLSIEDNLEDLRVDVPAENVQAFVAALGRLGLVTPIETQDSKMFGGGIVQVRIQVLYNP